MKLKALAVVLAAAVCVPAFAQQPGGSGAAVIAGSAPGKGAVVGAVEVRAKVLSIDSAERTITVKGPKGNVVTVAAGDEVKNFDQIKVGDDIVLQYVRAVALELKKGGGGVRERTETDDAVRAKPGERPAGAVGRKVTVTADVIAVDAKNQILTLKGPKQTVELKIENPEQFKLVKKGDQVQATFVEAVAISVEPGMKKK